MNLGTAQTLAVIFGASEFQLYPAFDKSEGGPAFDASSRAFRASLEAQFGADWLSTNVLDLFNSKDPAADQAQRLRKFLLANRENATRLILYYVGHGGFFAGQEYFLALRTTEKDNEHFTGLSARALADVVGKTFVHGQVYIVLDCCFAGEAMRHFQSDEVNRQVETKTLEAFPAAGTALLCASSKDKVAVSKGQADCTQFSECLTDVLLNGVADGRELLTLRDVGVATTNRIQSRFGQEAVHPEIQSPRQTDGVDPADQPLFHNRAWQGNLEQLRPDLAERLRSEDRISRLGVVAELKRLLNGSDLTLSSAVRAALTERLSEEHGERDFAVRDVIADALDEVTREPKPPVGIDRRKALVGGVIALSGIAGASALFVRQQPPPVLNGYAPPDPDTSQEPRLKKLWRHKYRIKTPGLDSGYYANIRSGVLHYVTRDGFIRHCNPFLLISNLQPTNFTLNTESTFELRQNLVYASVSTEEAALTKISSQAYDEACRLLMMGIENDWTLKRQVGGAPSVRLYDLLAAISVRHGREEYLRELTEFLRRIQQDKFFASRIKKWNDPDSKWNRTLRDRSHRRRWRLSVGYGSYKEVSI